MNTLIPVFSAPALDGGNAARHNPLVAFNRATGFSSPKTVRQTSRRYPISGGIFTSAFFPLLHLSLRGGRGGRPCACRERTARSANPPLSVPPSRLAACRWAFRPSMKGNNIMPKIRRAFSRPLISQKLRTFRNLREACRYIDRLTVSDASAYRFNIVQQGRTWTVCRVIAGEA